MQRISPAKRPTMNAGSSSTVFLMVSNWSKEIPYGLMGISIKDDARVITEGISIHYQVIEEGVGGSLIGS